jgi:hypothetical protein
MTRVKRTISGTGHAQVEIIESTEPLSAQDVRPGVFFVIKPVDEPVAVSPDFPDHLESLGASVQVVEAARAAGNVQVVDTVQAVGSVS